MSSQRTNIPKQAPLAQFQPHGAQTFHFQVLFGTNPLSPAIGAPIQLPYFRVPPGGRIEVRPVYAGLVNQKAFYIGDNPEQVQAGRALTVYPDGNYAIVMAVDNLNELWVASGQSQTDGCTIVVTVPAIQ